MRQAAALNDAVRKKLLDTYEILLRGQALPTMDELGVCVSTVGDVEFSVRDAGSNFVIEFIPVAIEGEPVCNEHSARLGGA